MGKKPNENTIVSVYFRCRGTIREKPTDRICHECKGMLTFTDRNFAGKLNYRGIVSRIVQLRIRAMYWHAPRYLLFSFPPDGFAMEIAPRARKFLFSVLFIPHFSSPFLPFPRPQKREVKNPKNEKLPKGIKRLGHKKFSKSWTRYREIGTWESSQNWQD